MPDAMTVIAGVNAASNLFSGFGSSGSSKRWTNHWNRVSMEKQDELNKNQIQWRVNDAKKAGLHPLAALGMSPASSGLAFNIGDTSRPDIGQAVSRATQAFMTTKQRQVNDTLTALHIRNAELQNEALETQINASKTAIAKTSATPAWNDSSLPIQGQNSVVRNPAELTSKSTPSTEAGVMSMFRYARTPSGNLAVVPAKEYKESIEDMFGQDYLHLYRSLKNPPKPPSNLLPHGAIGWRRSGIGGLEWEPVWRKMTPKPRQIVTGKQM